MRFGFCVPNNQGIEDPAELLELARLAEQLGYDSIWVSERLFHASYVAARRRVTRFGDGWHPLSLSPAELTPKTEHLRGALRDAGRPDDLPIAGAPVATPPLTSAPR